MPSRPAALLAWLFAVAAVEAAAQQEAGLKLSGYYKNILIASRTLSAAGGRYGLDLNRLRLELKGKPVETATLDLQYDNELLLGSYLRTAQFASQKDQPSAQYWNLEGDYSQGRTHYGRQRLYRASVTLAAGDTDLRLGRQRIAWGTGRFWSPLDLLNPFSPIQLERDERAGVDAALLERKFGALSRLGAVYAPQHARRDASAGLLWHDNAAGVDYSLVAGRFARERLAGADLATQLGAAGVRAELTRARRPDGSGYRRALLGLDYAFANTLTLSGELFYDGAGAANRGAYDYAALFAGRIQNLGRRYLGAYAGYEITPLLKWTNALVVNVADRSRYFSPVLTYSLRANLDLTLGVQLFRGGAGTEYAGFRDLYYAQAQWFF
jgi:hypothetical protein